MLSKTLRAAYSSQQISAYESHGESHGCDGESFERHCSRYFDGQSRGLFLWLVLPVAPVNLAFDSTAFSRFGISSLIIRVARELHPCLVNGGGKWLQPYNR